MSKTYTALNSLTDTFAGWLSRTNDLSADMTDIVVTASPVSVANASNQSQITGNSHIKGIFGTDTLIVSTALRGGDAETGFSDSINLQITSNTVIGANATSTDTLTVYGVSNLDGGIAVDTTNFTVSGSTGDTVIAGTLGVTGISTMGVINASGLASLDAGIDVDGAFTVADTTGNISTTGTLAVTGVSNLEGGIDINSSTIVIANTGTITTTGLASLDGGIDVDGSFTVSGSTGNTVVGATLSVTGDTSLSTATATGLVNLNGGIDVDSGNFTVSGTNGNVVTLGTVTANGLASLDGGIDVNGALFTVASGTGNVTTSGNLIVNGNTDLGDNVADTVSFTASVDSNILPTGSVDIGSSGSRWAAIYTDTIDISGSLAVANLNVSGLSSLDGGIDVDGAFTVADTTGNIITTGTLGVTGVSTMGIINASGLASLDAGIDVDGAFTVADTTGNIITTGTIGVTGISTLGIINASGLASLDGGIDVDGAFTVADTTGNINTSGTLDVTGITNLNNATNSTSYTTGALVVDGGLGVALDSFFNGDVDINGNLTISGDSSISANDNTADYMTALVLFDSQGDTDLGNAITDTITFTGRADSSLIPIADSTYDLGSSSLYWSTIYADNVTLSGGDQFIQTGVNDIGDKGITISSNTDVGSPTANILWTWEDDSPDNGTQIARFRKERTPVAGENLGRLAWQGRDSVATDNIYYSYIETIADNVTNGGSESGSIRFGTRISDALGQRMALYNGLVIGSPTGSDQGIGTLNASNIYDDGKLVLHEGTNTLSETLIFDEGFRVVYNASATTYLQVTGGGTGTGPIVQSGGESDATLQLLTSGNGNMFLDTAGTGSISLRTAGGTTQAQIVHTASAVNYVSVSGGSTGVFPSIRSSGEAGVGLNIRADGTGDIFFTTDTDSNVQFQVAHTASAVESLQVTGATAEGNPTLQTVGTGTNPGMRLLTKGAGALLFDTGGSGVLSFRTEAGSSEQFRVSHTASAVNYINVQGGPAGVNPSIRASGEGTVGLTFRADGTGDHTFTTDTDSNVVFSIKHTASAVNYLSVYGNTTGQQPFILSAGETNVGIWMRGKGTGVWYSDYNQHVFRNPSNETQFIIGNTASSVNYFTMYGAATGNDALLDATGETNVGISIRSKGTGNINFMTAGGASRQFQVGHEAGTIVNYLQVRGAVTGGGVRLEVQGSDANAYIRYITQGSGAHHFDTGSENNRQFLINHTASATTYIQVTGSSGNNPILSTQPTNSSLGIYANGNAWKVNIGDTTNGANYNVYRSGGIVHLDSLVASTYNRAGTTGGNHYFMNSASATAFRVNHVASEVNYIQVQANTTGNVPVITFLGETNTGGQLKGTGTGNLYLDFDTINLRTNAGSGRATLVSGLVMEGATGGDQGVGTINCTEIYKNGVAVSGGLFKVTVYTAGATWTKDAATVAVRVRLVAGGGGGGKGTAAAKSGGGGGAGEYAEGFFDSGVGATETVTIGAGGAGSTGGNGGNGGTTSFGSLLTALGGVASIDDLSVGALGGSGGTGGDFHAAGGHGGGGQNVGAGSGDGGASFFGSGGACGPIGGNPGQAGVPYGSGGGGGSNQNGGAGAGGWMIVEEYK